MAAYGLAATSLAVATWRRDSPTVGVAQRPGTDPIVDLAYDVEGIHHVVAESTRDEPYSSVLPGARGTLAARAGNSADQALPLAALLDASLAPAHFAIGRLDAEGAERIAASAVHDAAGFLAAASDAFTGSLPRIAPPSVPGLDAPAGRVAGQGRSLPARHPEDVRDPGPAIGQVVDVDVAVRTTRP